MHVGFSLLTLFPGRAGGSETYVRGLLGAFAAGHGPQRLTVLGNRRAAEMYGGRVVRTYRPGDRDATRLAAMVGARAVPRLVAADLPRDLDVLHFPVTVPAGVVRGVPRVVTVHDVQHHEMPEMFGRGERWFRGWAYDEAARRADVVVTISEHARSGLVRNVGVPAERIVVIPHGVDHGRFRPDGPARDDLGDYVLYPANLWPHKNHARLLEAWRETDPALTLVLTGATFGRELEGERVRHLGHVPAADLPALYRGARALVFPSLFEGFGLPVLEAMASGTPVASSDRGPLRELCGDAALTFDPEDPAAIAAAVTAVTRDEELRARLREAGLRRAAGFTWSRCAEDHLQAYERARRAAPASRRRRSRSTPVR